MSDDADVPPPDPRDVRIAELETSMACIRMGCVIQRPDGLYRQCKIVVGPKTTADEGKTEDQLRIAELEAENARLRMERDEQVMKHRGTMKRVERAELSLVEATTTLWKRIADLESDLSEAVAVFVGLMELGDPDEATEEAVDRNIQFWARARAFIQKHEARR